MKTENLEVFVFQSKSGAVQAPCPQLLPGGAQHCPRPRDGMFHLKEEVYRIQVLHCTIDRIFELNIGSIRNENIWCGAGLDMV